MNISRKLMLEGPNGKRVVVFGEATTQDERQEVFGLRYKVYSKLGYIDSTLYPDQLENDTYDTLGKSRYFIARLEEEGRPRVIGCIRLIMDDPLPTEIDFKFEEPQELKLIPRNQRAELGRFIIVPPSEDRGDFLPRGMTMLFLLNVLSEYGVRHNLLGGYAFIKESLNVKLKKAKLPVGYIKDYKQRYPKDGILRRYFTQPEDPVIPIFFITHSFYERTQKIIHTRLVFKSMDNIFTVKRNMYTWLLGVFKVI